jgi:ketosteroid isomerase-like protein
MDTGALERLLRRGYDHFNATGTPLEESFVADVVLVEADAVPVGGRTYEGYPGVLAALDQLTDAFDDLRIEPERLLWEGDRALVHVRLTGHGRGSGVPVSTEFWHAFDFRDGLIARWEVHLNRPGRAPSRG